MLQQSPFSAIPEDIFFDTQKWESYWNEKYHNDTKDITTCKRCVYDSRTPGISFNSEGVCSYCHQHDDLYQEYCINKGPQYFEQLVEKIKKAGKRKPYDVAIGVSGGCDSSYLIHMAKELGLRPLAVHFDNTWNSSIAVENIDKVLSKNNVELYTHVVDNDEYDEMYRAILKAGTPDLEAPTDLAFATTLRAACEKHGIKYFFEGHSFQTEGLSPLGWLYMDSKYVNDMYKKHGNGQKLKTIPHMWLYKQLKWMLVNRFVKVRPLWYLNYDKNSTKAMLSDTYDWEWYGGHHLENQITAFYHAYFLPRRFGIDQRANGYSALIRSGQMSRKEALESLATAPQIDMTLFEMVVKRLGFSQDEFTELMCLPKKTYKDYENYRPTFIKMRPFFYLMAKMELVPMSFYLKYTAKDD